MSAQLLVISCGGTFDKAKFTRAGKFVCGAPQATAILSQAAVLNEHCEVLSLLRKDSLDMDDADRQLVLNTVLAQKQQHIVVIHGTDTLLTTAQLLDGNCAAKTVVLAGAMRPAVFTASDAAFNLGFALGAACCQPTGVWVAMHGRLWTPGQVAKDTAQMRFIDRD